MDAEAVVVAMRGGWLTLCFMMLASRVLFQAAGPARMRQFLERWASSRVKRAWGAASLAFAALLAAAAAPLADELETLDLVLLAGLVLLLLADGLVNVLPAGFHTFKDSVQKRWVQRHAGTGRAGDRDLFAVGNAVLALLAGGAAALVALYRPLAPGLLVLALALTAVLTPILLGAVLLEPRSRGRPPSGETGSTRPGRG